MNEPKTPGEFKHQSMVCASCGNQTLLVDSGGGLTCFWIGCKEPCLTRDAHEVIKSARAEVKRLGEENEELLTKLREAVDLGTAQADEFDRFWSAIGCLDKEISVDQAIEKWNHLTYENTTLLAKLAVCREALEIVRERCCNETYSDYKARLEGGIAASQALTSTKPADSLLEKVEAGRKCAEALKHTEYWKETCTHRIGEPCPTRTALSAAREKGLI